jgi:glucoamylase
MLPEQIWDGPELPELELSKGQPTGSAMPLMWAHAEYIKLLRSVRDGLVFDRIPAVAERYLAGKGRKDLEVWKTGRQVRTVAPGVTLRILHVRPFDLHWSLDEWSTPRDTRSGATRLGVHHVDLVIPPDQRSPLRFTFHWIFPDAWDETDHQVDMKAM